MATTAPGFIVIDDDAINNSICERLVAFAFPGTPVHTFTNAASALTHISGINANHVLLLDIDMPDPTGWEFLQQFDQLPADIRQLVRVLILSSSVNPADIEAARTNASVTGYILKPLSITKLQEMVNSLHLPFIDMSVG